MTAASWAMQTLPAAQPPRLALCDVRKVVAGNNHVAIIKTDGTLWMAGDNAWLQLGDGTDENRSTPVRVMSGVADVACGGRFTQVLGNDGSRWGCGDNRYGQLEIWPDRLSGIHDKGSG